MRIFDWWSFFVVVSSPVDLSKELIVPSCAR